MPTGKNFGELMAASPSTPIDVSESTSIEVKVIKKPDGKYAVEVRIDNIRAIAVHSADMVITDLLGRIGSHEDMGRPGNARALSPI